MDLWEMAKNYVGSSARFIVDAGANDGCSSRSFRSWCPQATILCIEPDPRAFAQLEGNKLALCVSTAQCALSDEDGEADFFTGDVTSAISSLQPRSDGYSGPLTVTKSIRVQTRKLDTLLDNLSWPQVDFLKLDLQGGELKALRGAKEALRGGFIRVIVSEIWLKPTYREAPHLDELDAFLKPYGFVQAAMVIVDKGSGEGIWGDALFVRV